MPNNRKCLSWGYIYLEVWDYGPRQEKSRIKTLSRKQIWGKILKNKRSLESVKRTQYSAGSGKVIGEMLGEQISSHYFQKGYSDSQK